MQKCIVCSMWGTYQRKSQTFRRIKHDVPFVNNHCMWPLGSKSYIWDQKKRAANWSRNATGVEWVSCREEGSFLGVSPAWRDLLCCGSWWEWEGGGAQAMEADCRGTPFFHAPSPSQKLGKPCWFSPSFCSSPNTKVTSVFVFAMCVLVHNSQHNQKKWDHTHKDGDTYRFRDREISETTNKWNTPRYQIYGVNQNHVAEGEQTNE